MENQPIVDGNQPLMENKPILELPEAKKSHTLLAVIISVVVTAALVGGGVYYWQNILLNEAEETTSEVTPVQTATIKPIVTSPQSGATVEDVSKGVKIIGKAAPNSFVWLFQIWEEAPDCLNLSSALTLGDRTDTSGNFEINYIPDGNEESWSSEFSVVSLNESQKYQLKWLENTFCAPDDAKSNYFELTLKRPATNILFQDDIYRLRITDTTKECGDFYSARVIEGIDFAKKIYGIFASGSESWPQGQPVFTYAIYTRKIYDELSMSKMFGDNMPQIIMYLDSGDLLTQWPSQASPSDVPQECQIHFEKF